MTLTTIGLALVLLAGFLVWLACDRFWHGLVILALAFVLFALVAATLTGDVSRVLPAGTFADGSDGKDQIVLASTMATILVSIMLAACLFGVVKAGWRRLRR